MKRHSVAVETSGSAGQTIDAHVPTGITRLVRRVMPAIGLFLVAPLVAEFLLGNMSVTHLGLLGILAPLYGGGALVIRECVRRTGRCWTSIFLLALVYGIVEEAFLTESLFNPNYLGLNLHLLQPAFVPAFGMGACYTVLVLTLHTVWSISVPIALIESLVPQRAQSPWIGGLGLGIVATLFTLACIAMGSFSIRSDANRFVASPAQFVCSAVIVVALIALAFALPRRPANRRGAWVPHAWLLGAGSFTVASAFLLIPREWGWRAVFAYVLLEGVAILSMRAWSGRSGWAAIHRLGLAGGAAVAYGVHAFFQTPSLGKADTTTRIGNLIFIVLATNLIAAGADRLRGLRARAAEHP